MSGEFTQFPWVISQPNGQYTGWRVGPAWLGYAESETNNDRHLISAAPDLLEALKAFRDGGPEAGGSNFNGWHRSYDDAIEKARAAIAKAEGQS